MTYDEALKKWAAKKLDVSVDSIDSVTVDMEGARSGWCDTCDYGAESARLTFKIAGENTQTLDVPMEEYWLSPFTDFLAELVEVASSPV